MAVSPFRLFREFHVEMTLSLLIARVYPCEEVAHNVFEMEEV